MIYKLILGIRNMLHKKIIIVSVHDISSKYTDEIFEIIRRLDKINIKKKDLLVVLNFDGKYNIRKDKKLIGLLKHEFKKDNLAAFHGSTHYQEKMEGIDSILYGKDFSKVSEFHGLDKARIKSTIKKGVVEFKMIFKIMPKLFVPARWEVSNGIEEVCKKEKIAYFENFKGIVNLNKNIRRASFICSFDMGSNILLNRAARIYAYLSIFLAQTFKRPLRYCIHPNDIHNNNFEFELRLLRRLINKGWTTMNTEEYWKNEC